MRRMREEQRRAERVSQGGTSQGGMVRFHQFVRYQASVPQNLSLKGGAASANRGFQGAASQADWYALLHFVRCS